MTFLSVVTMSAGSLAVTAGSAYADGNNGNNGNNNANVPAAPASVSASISNKQITVSWTASPSNGGYAITKYTAQAGEEDKSCTVFTSTPGYQLQCVISNLENNHSYNVCVTASNSKGKSASTCQASVTPVSVPTAPLSPTASYGSNLITISWTAPSGTVTGYTVIDGSNASTTICTTSTTSCTWNGFTWGTRYTFKVKATNAAGSGVASALSNAITPSTVPSPPQSVTVTRSSSKLTVAWSAPATTGGSSITGYTATATPGGASCSTTTARTCQITGLTNGTSYTVSVVATNANGNSNASDASSVITPADAPTSPTNTRVSFDGSHVRIDWDASDSNGDDISSYKVYDSHNNVVCTAGGHDNECEWDGYTKGSSYYFRVSAVNSVGESSKSSATSTVTPKTAPAAPTSATAVAGNAKATISWTAPTDNGGAAISGYRVTSTPGNFTCSTNASTTTCQITGLTNGTHYTFAVTATNSIGTSLASANSNDVVPMTLPTAPRSLVATSTGHGTVNVSFTAPASNGGGTIVGYTVTAQPGGATCYTSTLSCDFSGLSYATNYTFTAIATNDVGNGPASVTSNSVIFYSAPGNPTILSSSAASYVQNYYGSYDPTVTFNIAAPADWGSSTGTNLGSMTFTVTGPNGQIDQQIVPVTSDGNGGVNYTNTFTYTSLAQWSSYTATLVASNSDGTSQTVSKTLVTSGDLVEPQTLTVFDSSKKTLAWKIVPTKSSTDAIYTLSINGTALCSGTQDQVTNCVQKNVNTTSQSDVTVPVFTEPFSVTIAVPGMTSKTWNYTEKLYYVNCPVDNTSCTRYVGNHYIYISSNLRGVDLSNLDLQGSSFWQSTLVNAKVDGADLSNSFIQNSDLTGLQSWGTNYAGSYLFGDGVSRARFVNPNFSMMSSRNLTGTPYWICGASVAGNTWNDFPATLSHASESASCRYVNGVIIASGVKLSNADLRNADLSGLSLGNIVIYNSNLAGANLSNIVTAFATITGTNLDGTNLSGAVLSGLVSRQNTGTPSALPNSFAMRSGYLVGPGVIVNFRDLRGVDFSGVNFTGAVLSNDDLRGANLAGANLTNVVFGPVTALGMPNNLSNASRLSNVDFSGASLAFASILSAFPSQASGQWLTVAGTAPASLPSTIRFDAANHRLQIK